MAQEADPPERPINTVTKKVTRDLEGDRPLNTQGALIVDPGSMENWTAGSDSHVTTVGKEAIQRIVAYSCARDVGRSTKPESARWKSFIT